MNETFSLRIRAMPADVFMTMFALSFVTFITALVLAVTGISTPFVALPAIALYAASSIVTWFALHTLVG